MVCPHCKSTDIITVQGQRFCIGCGRVLADPPPVTQPTAPAVITPVAEPPAAAPAVATATPSVASDGPKRRKPGRPKAGRLDVVPPPSVITQPVPAASARIQRSSARSTSRAKRRLSDLAPAGAQATQPESKVVLAGAQVQSLRERFRPAVFGWSLMPAGLLAIIAGAVTFVLARNQATAALTLTQQAGWAVWGEFVWIALLYYVSRSLAVSVTVYGVSRRADHRPSSQSHQLVVAMASWWPRLRLDLLTGSLQLVVIALAVGLVLVGGVRWPLPDAAQVAVLFMAFMALGYAFVGLGLIQGLGHVGLVLGKISAGRAFALGWSFFRRHFELVGYKVGSLLVELAFILPLVAAVVALLHFLPPEQKWLAALAAAALTLLGGALIGGGLAVWWQATYSHLVQRYHPDETAKLLAGRQPERLHRGVLSMTLVVFLSIVILAIAWPWLPQQL